MNPLTPEQVKRLNLLWSGTLILGFAVMFVYAETAWNIVNSCINTWATASNSTIYNAMINYTNHNASHGTISIALPTVLETNVSISQQKTFLTVLWCGSNYSFTNTVFEILLISLFALSLYEAYSFVRTWKQKNQKQSQS